MKRQMQQRLLEWKTREKRKPLLLLGARQVGKTYLIEMNFGKKEFENFHKFDFREDRKRLHSCFDGNLEPSTILEKLSILSGQDIDAKNSLILFDEIQECPQALSSLKYFNEKMPNIHLCATGSYLGLHIQDESFPVGQIEALNLFPMSFEEFLWANGEKKAIEIFDNMSRLSVSHDKLWELLTDYYFVGGLPEAVGSWFGNKDVPVNDRASLVHDIHRNLITAYKSDFGKHSGKFNSLHIETVFENAAVQLSATIDGSVNRYRFKDVIAGKRNYRDLFGPLEWLVKTGLCHKAHLIDCDPKLPLKSISKENFFKLYLFDVGILGHLLEITYREQKLQEHNIAKGYFAENFVATEMKSIGIQNIYSWKGRNSEIEFIQKTLENEIIPIEVKSGSRTAAKSLKMYIDKYSPRQTLKLIGSAGGSDEKNLVMPLYYAAPIIKRLCVC